MRFQSITFRILFFIVLAFTVTTISVLMLASMHLNMIIDTSQEAVYSEKLDVIIRILKDSDDRLKKTGLVEAYVDDFKESALNILRKTYYFKASSLIYPFIIDKNGIVILHPDLKEGDRSIQGHEVTKNMLVSERGSFNYVYLGQKKWCIFKHFVNWDWVLAYTVPLDIKYSDTRKFILKLFFTMIGITSLVIVLLSLIITRFTKPIVRLTKISKKIASGDIDQEIDIKSKDEVGELAHSFKDMRNAIKIQIDELNKEIGEHRKSKVLLIKAKEKAEQINEVKSEFLMNVSHDIRTPMNVINGFNDLLLRTRLNEEQKKFCEMIKRKVVDLIRLIEDIIDISAVEKGKVRIHESFFDVRQLIKDVCDSTVMQIGKKGIELKCNISEDVPQKLLGDSLRLKQVLENLCTNAVKYTKKGRIDLTVFLDEERYDEDASFIRFEVEDTGIGISEDKIPHIFEPYTRFYDSANNEYKEGFGMGLHIVEALLTEMGSVVTVESEVGKGSKFSFRLKIKYSEMQDIAGKTVLTVTPNGEVDLSGLKILVAEDDDATRVLMERSFRDAKCIIKFVCDGDEAIEEIKKDKYDLVLMDIRMPKMDGLDTTKEIREHLDKDVPILALTAHVMDYVEEKCKEVGMSGFLAKPVDIDMLKRAIIKFAKPK
ncbi:MAG: hypothetical protein A2Y03_01545 [Omnitrophica WOR_2 bacterium GWF2_38_59]|nr:MAG: hypothetical protein A2Y03_01545 [Omnitrophica WOR_2 bacterium GWF2_38_59]OGX46641.1 MAG: hypothetical protein A2243_04145 [Omnitrophica WOR_2 bacterium RIFOXYA2_FULL_38_17]OGX55549.1 MAG: hypothetical protein A2447_05250 [Omnitrophica WOR_2 bacterium RIFOXYC2_FULL_38_12]OGX59418.1 MAG: hypothetical protein A2306_04070 [Omnitrophica WOR_2 bacterium RIFOXYB2_FULL_38_16]